MNRLWNDNTRIPYNMYQPICSGNESNILQCHYDVTNTLPNRCTNYRYYYSNEETSVVCLPGILSWYFLFTYFEFLYLHVV